MNGHRKLKTTDDENQTLSNVEGQLIPPSVRVYPFGFPARHRIEHYLSNLTRTTGKPAPQSALKMKARIRKKLPWYELKGILSDHRCWLESKGSSGRRAYLGCRDLSNRDLFDIVLERAVLEDIDFSHANLRTANLK